jgi:hypothetical protein
VPLQWYQKSKLLFVNRDQQAFARKFGQETKVVVGNNAREDSQDGEPGLDDQQLGNPTGGKDQPDGVGDEEKPQGNSHDEA